jgi:uncharacterized protein YhbP (UPF0306 family)
LAGKAGTLTEKNFLEVKNLLSPSTLALATVGEGGTPHVAPVYFTNDDRLNLYFFSDPLSQHGIDLARDGRAAVAIYPEVSGWQEIRGLQLRGEARPMPPGPEWQAAWERYASKFPFARELEAVVAQNQLYKFIPGWIRLVDNRRGFGYKIEWMRRQDGGGEGEADSTWQAIEPGGRAAGGADGRARPG